MRLIDAAFGALGLVLLTGTAYAAMDSDLTGARPTPVQMEHEGFEAPEGAEGYEGYERHEADEYSRAGGLLPQAVAQSADTSQAGQTTGGQTTGGNAATQPLSLQDAIARVGAMGYTRILEAEYEHGRYEIEALDDQGRKVEIYLDAQTGQTLKQGYDD